MHVHAWPCALAVIFTIVQLSSTQYVVQTCAVLASVLSDQANLSAQTMPLTCGRSGVLCLDDALDPFGRAGRPGAPPSAPSSTATTVRAATRRMADVWMIRQCVCIVWLLMQTWQVLDTDVLTQYAF